MKKLKAISIIIGILITIVFGGYYVGILALQPSDVVLEHLGKGVYMLMGDAIIIGLVMFIFLLFAIYNGIIEADEVQNQDSFMYEVQVWPDVQILMELDGFKDNSVLIIEEPLFSKYGSSAYLVNVEWFKSTNIESKK